MKKQDLLILVLLFALWLAWPTLDRHVVKKYFFPRSETVPAAPAAEAPPAAAAELSLTEPGREERIEAGPAEAAPPKPERPEVTAELQNDKVRITVSSYGAGLRGAELKEYPLTAAPGSGPVVLDFSAQRALAYQALEGLDGRSPFELSATGPSEVMLERTTPAGLKLQRTIRLADGYLIKIEDRFSNTRAEAIRVPAQILQTGPMYNLPNETVTRGVLNHGVDTLSPGGEGVKHWGSKLTRWFDQVRTEKNLPGIPEHIEWPLDAPLDWVAVKNKYFVQILTPDGGAEKCRVQARRSLSEMEARNPPAKSRGINVESVSVSVLFAELELAPGGTFTRALQYYVGPKKYTELSFFGQHQVDVMEFGMWAPIGKLLLQVMNGIHRYLWPHNYGIAIMLLTILIRVLFWPITHKSTESMRKMQEIQPLINAVRQKHKDNAQKQQQEIMALYKEHKVNPLGGCLPMIVQIPVFIALFVVLRSAIELRFAPFLWIRDLSQPENLLAGLLPFGLSLNILPLVMAVTMAWQQKMTPSGGDPNQQKMMMFMPVMMLVLFYNFAAGLVLYWTTNQCLMIAQQLLMQRRKKAAVGK